MGAISLQLQTAKLPGSQLDMTFKLDDSDVRRAFDKVYGELAQQGAIPGFRPGRAPASVIKRRFKPEILRDMFWMKAVETFVEPEMEKEDLHVIGQPDFPDFEQIEVAEGLPVEFTLKVTVRPEPELPEYKGLKLHRVAVEVTDEQVAAVLEQMRQTAAKEQPVSDRAVQTGDIVATELKITLEGQDEPVHTSSQSFEVGSGRYQPAIDEALIGHSLDESVTLDHAYPEDHEDEELAGQKATLGATIDEIRERLLPELDDEFAKTQGEYESLEQLQTEVRERLETEATQRSAESLENDALSAVVRDTTIDLPEILIEDLSSRGFASFAEELQSNGMSVAEFAEIANTDAESLRRNERMRAELALKVQFVLGAIAEAEGVEVDESALDEEISLFAAEAKVGDDFVRNALDLQDDLKERLEDRATRRLTIQKLIDDAEIEDVTQERYDEIKEQERQAAREKAEAEAAEAAAAQAAAEAEAAAAAETEAAPTEEADEAAETADEAADTADEAAETADEATETADEAAETADEAAETADEAAETADEAAETADEAAETVPAEEQADEEKAEA
jgi:trigger factor